MKILVILLIYSVGYSPVLAQNKNCIKHHDSKGYIVDSIKMKILQDTLLFKVENLKFTNAGIRNIKNYSKLYIINQRYLYKLDILSAREVKDFVMEFMKTTKIENISFIDKNNGLSLYGPAGGNGVVLITLKKGTKLNLKIANLKTKNKRSGYGDNFSE